MPDWYVCHGIEILSKFCHQFPVRDTEDKFPEKWWWALDDTLPRAFWGTHPETKLWHSLILDLVDVRHVRWGMGQTYPLWDIQNPSTSRSWSSSNRQGSLFLLSCPGFWDISFTYLFRAQFSPSASLEDNNELNVGGQLDWRVASERRFVRFDAWVFWVEPAVSDISW